MRLVNVFFIVLLLLVLMVLGNLYLTNHDLLVQEVNLFGESIKLQSVILITFLLGFLLNVLYTGIMEIIRLVRGLNDSADTRLVKRISERMQEARDLMAHGLPREAKEILAGILEQRREHIPARIDGRVKRPYSVFQKIKRQKISIDQVYDLMALRIITDSVKNCYAALGVIHNKWRPIPGRIKDFIAIPRPNLYLSLIHI